MLSTDIRNELCCDVLLCRESEGGAVLYQEGALGKFSFSALALTFAICKNLCPSRPQVLNPNLCMYVS